ncbi:MAG: hypothetical protein IKZ82_00420 [Clostridia bacterium]|nr:hypothetical protein [Clostridia bacterium]
MLHTALIIIFAIVIILAAAFGIYFDRKKRHRSITFAALRFKKLVLHEYGRTAEENEYELIRTEKGLRISNYFGNWWDDDNGERSRKNCLARRRSGSLELYGEIVKDFERLDIASWNGFNETDPDVCDGQGFWLEIVLDNGSLISARGINAFPPNYRKFIEMIHGLFDNKENA